MKEQPFELGDIVVSRYYKEETSIKRKVTKIEEDKGYQSGWKILTELFEQCLECKRYFGTEIIGWIDSGWYKKI